MYTEKKKSEVKPIQYTVYELLITSLDAIPLTELHGGGRRGVGRLMGAIKAT